jgi:hypothetical protein
LETPLDYRLRIGRGIRRKHVGYLCGNFVRRDSVPSRPGLDDFNIIGSRRIDSGNAVDAVSLSQLRNKGPARSHNAAISGSAVVSQNIAPRRHK